MNIRFSIICCLLALFGFSACNDEDTFSASSNQLLSFSTDSVKLDTLFSTVPSAAKSFWVYNRSGKGVRCSGVRLERGNQTGFRVNVDGIYLGKDVGYQTSDIEIRSNDSIRVYVELTSTANDTDAPQRVEDNLVFTLESGRVQKVNLNAYSWDAVFLRDFHVTQETVLSGDKPIVIYGKLKVEENQTLRIAAGTTLYFNQNAGIDVYGRLLVEGTTQNEVILRGDRLDKMFDYLPYDGLSGQWQGIHFYSSSYDNSLSYAHIRGAYHGVVIDSASVDRQKLTMNNSTVHNSQGYGLLARYAQVSVSNSVFSNALKDCVAIEGGETVMSHCTIAQFYPFDSNRGVALRFGSGIAPLTRLACYNTLITGYADDEVMRSAADAAHALHFEFQSCLLRTPREETADSVYFQNIVYENVKDTMLAGGKNFQLFDTEHLRYDFRLKETSLAIGKANKTTSLPIDRDGKTRDELPDIGAYEYFKP